MGITADLFCTLGLGTPMDEAILVINAGSSSIKLSLY